MDRRRGSRKAGHTGGGTSSEERQRGKIASSSSSQATLPSVSPSSIAGDFEKKLELSVTSVSGAGPSSYSKSLTPPARPGFGRLGTKCMIKANHFLVQVSSKELFHYDVAITPEVTSKGVNRSIIRELVRQHRDSHLGKRTPVYDGKKSLYTAGPLPFISEEFVVDLDDGDKGSVQPRRTRTFKVAIKLVAQHNLHNLQQFLSGKQFDVPQDVIQILDIVLRESPSINYSCIGRSFFSRQLGPAKELPDGLECWRGFYQSIRLTQMGLTLNLDFSATSFYEPLVVAEFVMKHLNLRDLSNMFNEHARIKVKRALKGVKVLTIHRKDLHRQYRISGITNLSATQLTFDENGTMVSVAQYFRERYKFPLRYPNLPCLQVGSDKKPTYLPMEACQIVDGQRYSMKLNDRQVKAILKEACQRPREREQHIRQMVQQNKYHGDKYALEFGINVKEQLTIEARVLPPPMLKYHETGRESKCLPRIGQWNMINKKMVGGGTVHYWACVNFSRTPHNLCEQFCHSLSEMCGNIGMNYQRNPLFPIISSPGNKIETALHKVYEDSVSLLNKRDKGKQLQLLIVILPDISGEYGKIKRICETELGIVSQCCQPRNITRPNNQYLENVALKINVKVGGRNTVLVDAISRKIPLVTDKPTILFGADVTHPNPGEDSGPSIAAVVASMDWPEITKYRGLVSSQRHRQEIIDDLYTEVADAKSGIVRGGIIRDHLRAFYRANNRKPERIIFYRDGVSEGQFSQVLLYELNAIWKACASLEEGYLPPLTFVVVQKRHHTRLFPMDPKNTDKSGNILPGTVVDTNICHPIEFDFYLNSHAGIQGTSRPTHYHVLWDDNKFSADALETFTNNLCYTYARCTRSVSIVPPAYYAHLAAFRARYYIEDNASDGSSSAGTSQSTRGGTAAIRSLPKIKDNVKEVMFFC